MQKLIVVVQQYDGHADDNVVTLLEATDAAGTSVDTTTGTFKIMDSMDTAATDVLTRETAAASYTFANTASTKNCMCVLEFDLANRILDSHNYMTVKVTSAGSALNIVSALIIGVPRYANANYIAEYA